MIVMPGHGLMRLIKQFQSDAISGKSTCPKNLLNTDSLSIYKKDQRQLDTVFDHEKYDGIYFFYHRALCDNRLLATPMPMKKVCIAINNEKWADKTALVEFSDYMQGAKLVAGCNSNVISAFSDVGANIVRVSQSIDPKVFFSNREIPVSKRTGKGIVVGWSGSEKNPIKNLPMIKKACAASGVKLSIASDLNRKRLNEWYNTLDVVVCASSSEGGPLLLLEAGAVGIPVISTPVGLAREIVKDRDTGLLVDWTSESISKAINLLSKDRNLRGTLGRRLQREVLKNWTYEARLDEVRAVFKELCR